MKWGIGDSQMTDYEKKLDEIKENLEANKNVILTGAPGTGKTFMAKQIAKELGCEDDNIDFVQFHPSYDYTDFVEGLRPKQVDGSDQIGFERKDGVFKKFCERALLSQTINNKDFLENLNKNPKIWKVSLCRTGENEIRKDCLENNYIRIGWSEYGDIENFDDFENFSNGGKSILRSYQNEMQIGDIVLSCFSAKEIDAIGIITGDYEYKREGNEYPRYRNVKWIVKNIRENIIELNNGKSLTLSTIYKLSISLTDIKFIIEKYITGKSEEKEPTPFVFIIDEINRGEVAKIFGELFYCVDPGYRGEKGRISTQYQNLVTSGEFQKGFFIPENVYIIGTMNDIDRSVESMDFAFRRRFSWIEVKAEDTQCMLDAELDKDLADEAKRRMKNLNAEISKIEDLNDAYHIGASYFLKLKNYGGDFGKLWDYHIKGILQEYLRGNPKADEEITKLKAAYDKAEDLKAGE
jgi:5-methylcytosine-specific restriction endonuclease McrBC GTP-binding regulatory subunit McrB